LYERLLKMASQSLPGHAEKLTGENVKAEAHAVKGVLGNIGALALAEQAQALECNPDNPAAAEALRRELTVLAAKLTALFTQPEANKAASPLELLILLGKVSEAVGNYELPLARNILDINVTYGPQWDRRLERLRITLDAFDADTAAGLIEEWKRELPSA
jgi:HPt (histidine-containing phosphotransfer) domain-containing protein